jgi:hypothetical protein
MTEIVEDFGYSNGYIIYKNSNPKFPRKIDPAGYLDIGGLFDITEDLRDPRQKTNFPLDKSWKVVPTPSTKPVVSGNTTKRQLRDFSMKCTLKFIDIPSYTPRLLWKLTALTASSSIIGYEATRRHEYGTWSLDSKGGERTITFTISKDDKADELDEYFYLLYDTTGTIPIYDLYVCLDSLQIEYIFFDMPSIDFGYSNGRIAYFNIDPSPMYLNRGQPIPMDSAFDGVNDYRDVKQMQNFQLISANSGIPTPATGPYNEKVDGKYFVIGQKRSFKMRFVMTLRSWYCGTHMNSIVLTVLDFGGKVVKEILRPDVEWGEYKGQSAKIEFEISGGEIYEFSPVQNMDERYSINIGITDGEQYFTTPRMYDIESLKVFYVYE